MYRSAPPADEAFFVGYLDTPRALRGFLRHAAFLAVGLIIAAALLVALHQRSPGSGRWAYGEMTPFEGTVTAHPYPIATTGDGSQLLVGEGKVAADVSTLDGRVAHFIATVLDRDDLRMLETTAVAQPRGDDAPATYQATADRRTLRGEIIDPKCYLGAMKPGDGKPHKACAALCLRGGIPPMLRARDGTGDIELYLLVQPGGRPFTGEALEALINVIGEPVEVKGIPGTFGTIRTLELAAPDVHRAP